MSTNDNNADPSNKENVLPTRAQNIAMNNHPLNVYTGNIYNNREDFQLAVGQEENENDEEMEVDAEEESGGEQEPSQTEESMDWEHGDDGESAMDNAANN
ncbi:unnamed protein product [Caenorhabditis sp. 36 PRJEB53466]|nr:unnamed protein product [Caenorhabditis sp. 36 PRJEB53466]